ncbi:PREDICTED: LOW QUALITY PROTEIN: putative gustatory receptor 98b [Drosophila arizonae]|uniref:LOW QUALITY PROTEIN: putative gustatory receptor 98b n=1 Tax=Drosophila arizonae TaxID=7263 RepID=A0ABM1PGE8_DROAR|nr:PREDICTED: LOW QUALITY PROTEIN: putative gustatory receptor 98b [Drosophila arizonae]
MLTAARPYLQLLALLTLTPPLSFSAILLLGIDVTHVNIRILNFEILMLEVEDFTSAQGRVQKLCYPLHLIVIHGNMLIYFRKLGSIYTEIAALERDSDAASQSLGGLGKRLKFRQRLADWISVISLTEFMDWYYKIFTELILVMFQMKIVEYGLFVLFVEELLLLIQLQQEFTNCEHHALLQALCVALQRNKGNSNPEWLSNILREYVLQMEHLELRFSCRNFFDINLRSFGGMVLTIVSYSIILIQVKLKDLVEAKPKSLPKAQ